MQPGKLRGLIRLADPSGHFTMLAIDQRPPLFDLVRQRHGADEVGSDEIRSVAAIKHRVIDQLQRSASAVLVDPVTALGCFGDIDGRRGLLLTLESHLFDETHDGRTSAQIPEWSVERIKGVGGDAVKLLAWYRPDAAPHVRRHQQDFVAGVGEQCRRHDLPFVLELLTYPLPADAAGEHERSRSADILDSISEFADKRYAVDVFKVEPPPAGTHDEHAEFFARVDGMVDRPWVLLSGNREPSEFIQLLRTACDAGATGYLAGRSIWWTAVERYPDLADIERVLGADAARFMATLGDVVAEHGQPWRRQLRRLGAPVVDAAPPIGVV